MEKQNLPKWFKGSEYTKGDKVRNPLKHSISSGSVKKSNVQALHSLFEKMNSAKIFSGHNQD